MENNNQNNTPQNNSFGFISLRTMNNKTIKLSQTTHTLEPVYTHADHKTCESGFISTNHHL